MYTRLNYALLLITAALVASCSESEDPAADFVKLVGDTKTYVVYQKERYKSDRQIIVSTNGAWQAEITSMDKSADGEWISLWNNRGDSAGVHNIGVYVAQNTAEEYRHAEILVTSGKASQTFNITQRSDSEGSYADNSNNKTVLSTTLTARFPEAHITIDAKGETTITGYLDCKVSRKEQRFVKVRVVRGSMEMTQNITIGNTELGFESTVITTGWQGTLDIYFSPLYRQELLPDEIVYLTVTN
jgi:hypothetical protein